MGRVRVSSGGLPDHAVFAECRRSGRAAGRNRAQAEADARGTPGVAGQERAIVCGSHGGSGRVGFAGHRGVTRRLRGGGFPRRMRSRAPRAAPTHEGPTEAAPKPEAIPCRKTPRASSPTRREYHRAFGLFRLNACKVANGGSTARGHLPLTPSVNSSVDGVSTEPSSSARVVVAMQVGNQIGFIIGVLRRKSDWISFGHWPCCSNDFTGAFEQVREFLRCH